jgi:hypothetical protein
MLSQARGGCLAARPAQPRYKVVGKQWYGVMCAQVAASYLLVLLTPEKYDPQTS